MQPFTHITMHATIITTHTIMARDEAHAWQLAPARTAATWGIVAGELPNLTVYAVPYVRTAKAHLIRMFSGGIILHLRAMCGRNGLPGGYLDATAPICARCVQLVAARDQVVYPFPLPLPTTLRYSMRDRARMRLDTQPLSPVSPSEHH